MKKYILLLVLIINLVPYIKDGEMKWTTTEAGAQYYLIEDTGLNFYICGSIENPGVTVLSRISCDLLTADVDDLEEAEVKSCYCPACLSIKAICDEPCTSCGTVASVDEDGNDYYTGDPGCTCPICHAALTSCTSLCTNFLCSTNLNTGTGGQGSGNSGGGTPPPCALPSTFSKGIFTTNNYGDNHPNWCTYNTLAFIKGGTPCSWAMLDGKTCAEDDTTGMSPDDLKPFFESKGNVNFEVGAYSACELLQRVQDGQRALLCIRKAAEGNNYHVYLYWWFYKDAADTFNDILITCYDTEEGGRGFQVHPKDVIFGDINYMIY